jgi:hypothetical protein
LVIVSSLQNPDGGFKNQTASARKHEPNSCGYGRKLIAQGTFALFSALFSHPMQNPIFCEFGNSTQK